MRDQDEERDAERVMRAFGAVLAFALIVACVLLTSCKTQTVVVTEYRDRVTHDTTQVVDSVYRDRVQYIMQRGDTVYKTDSVFLYKFKYKDRVQVEYVRDSIPYPVEVEKIVRRRNGYDKFTSFAFWIMVALALLAAAWWAFRKFYLHK